MTQFTNRFAQEVYRLATEEQDPAAMELWMDYLIARARQKPPERKPNWRELTQGRYGYDRDIALSDRLQLPWEGHGMAHCPAHEDRSKSLSWKWENGRLLLHCFAGCTWQQIREAVQ